ncbi:HU family DNA-binding protein [Pseudomonas sp. 2FE]|uniref:HU family DNA-binding protein n=1 Tax=Pseudomonas sp. 2FE TaxID=2502190 RepID=UPI0010F527A9|nr:HU family DNA-binding protein [Pseudomonas sp. 2FE]
MNRQELVKAIADDTGHSQAAVGEMLNSLISKVQDAVAAGDKVALVGFGAFDTASRAERQGRNPATGQPITISASRLPKFTAGKAFKDQVNK